jgi:hypothetical protein
MIKVPSVVEVPVEIVGYLDHLQARECVDIRPGMKCTGVMLRCYYTFILGKLYLGWNHTNHMSLIYYSFFKKKILNAL